MLEVGNGDLTVAQVRQFRIDERCHGKITFLESQADKCECEKGA